MRILFVTPYYYPELKFGGPPKRIHGLSRGLQRLGHQVRVATYDSERRRARELSKFDGVEVQYVRWLGRGSLQIPMAVRGVTEAVAGADIVHCYGLYNLLCPLAAHLASVRRKPFLIEPMGMFVPRVRAIFAKKLYNAVFTNWMIRHSVAVVATSPLELEELRSVGAETNVVLRRNGVDFAAFSALPSSKETLRRWDASENDRIVLYLGRIEEKKNLHDLVRAFVQADVPASRLVIAGPASNEEYVRSLRGLIQSCGAAEKIYVDGPLYNNDHLAALAAADLFVLPSLNENFGNSAAEAVAAGIPVLLTETCGIAPIIHGRAGLAVPLGINPLSEGLRLMLKLEVKEQMTARREEVKRDLSLEEPIRESEALYERILKGG